MENINPTRYRSNYSIVSVIRSQGRSVAWLARQMDVSRQYMSDVVHGNRTVNAGFADGIAQHLQVPLFLLFDVSASTDNVAMEHVA